MLDNAIVVEVDQCKWRCTFTLLLVDICVGDFVLLGLCLYVHAS